MRSIQWQHPSDFTSVVGQAIDPWTPDDEATVEFTRSVSPNTDESESTGEADRSPPQRGSSPSKPATSQEHESPLQTSDYLCSQGTDY